MNVTLQLSPAGHLHVLETDEAPPVDVAVARRLIASFERGTGHGLAYLGTAQVGVELPAVLAYWRDFAARYVATVCAKEVPALEAAGVIVRLPAGWKAGRPPRPRVTGTVGTRPPAGIGADALLDFRMEVTPPPS